jgi:hypothetical protein
MGMRVITCNHESWECSGPNPLVRHKCSDCDWCWTNNNNPEFAYCELCRTQGVATTYVTKDSGVREEFDSGMLRDTDEGKANFHLLLHEGVAYEDQFLTRFAHLLTRGAKKYSKRNFEKGNSRDELERAKESLFRHMIQYLCGETDEDHAMAICFNVLLAELVKTKMRGDEDQV